MGIGWFVKEVIVEVIWLGYCNDYGEFERDFGGYRGYYGVYKNGGWLWDCGWLGWVIIVNNDIMVDDDVVILVLKKIIVSIVIFGLIWIV